MKRHKLRLYLIWSAVLFGILLINCLIPALSVIKNFRETTAVITNEKGIFISVFGSYNNYISLINVSFFHALLVLFFVNSAFMTEIPITVIRYPSREKIFFRLVLNCIMIALLMSALSEGIQSAFAFWQFDTDVVLNFGLPIGCFLEGISLFLFYLQIGIFLIILRAKCSKQKALIVATVLIVVQAAALYRLSGIIWLPASDAVTLIRWFYKIVNGNNDRFGWILLYARGIVLNTVLIIIARYLFNKKDWIHDKNIQKL